MERPFYIINSNVDSATMVGLNWLNIPRSDYVFSSWMQWKEWPLRRLLIAEIKVNAKYHPSAADLKENQYKLENHDTSRKHAEIKVIMIINSWLLLSVFFLYIKPLSILFMVPQLKITKKTWRSWCFVLLNGEQSHRKVKNSASHSHINLTFQSCWNTCGSCKCHMLLYTTGFTQEAFLRKVRCSLFYDPIIICTAHR